MRGAYNGSVAIDHELKAKIQQWKRTHEEVNRFIEAEARARTAEQKFQRTGAVLAPRGLFHPREPLQGLDDGQLRWLSLLRASGVVD